VSILEIPHGGFSSGVTLRGRRPISFWRFKESIMPLYEYVCEADGDVIELIRPMGEADEPVADPAGRGRTFTRKQSTFQAKGESPRSVGLPTGGCACGNPHGPCSTR
jgi:putative FmdB family regulatory protein